MTNPRGSLKTKPLTNVEGSGGLLKKGWNFAGLNATAGSSPHTEQTQPESAPSSTSLVRHNSARREKELIANMTLQDGQPPQDQVTTPSKPLTTATPLISLDSDSEDDLEIVSVKMAAPEPKQTQNNLPTSSARNSLSTKPRQPPKSIPAASPSALKPFISPAKIPSQAGKKGPPGLQALPTNAQFTSTIVGRLVNTKPGPIVVNDNENEELTSPEPTPGPGIARVAIEAGPSTGKSSAPGTPAKAISQAGKNEKKGPPGLKALTSTTKFTPTLVGRLLSTKPGPILINEDHEELTSPESSPGPGIARLQIEIGPQETKFVRQKPLPISISSDEDSDEEKPTKSHRRTTSELRLQYRDSMPKAAQAAKPVSSPPQSSPPQPIFEQQEIWPEESRGALAQAAVEYLNTVPQNSKLPMDVAEMLNLLGEQPDFKKLCSQIKKSGRTLAKSAFASAILSKLEPQDVEEPGGGKAVNRTEPSPRSKISTPARHSPNMSKKMTLGRIVDHPPSSTLSRTPVKPATKPRVPAELPRSNVAKVPPMSPEVISLMSPVPTSSQATSLEHVPKRRKVTEVAFNRNVTAVPRSSEVIVLDSPAPSSSTNPRFTSDPAAHKQARKNEVLDHIAERLLLHEGLGMLPRFIGFTTAQIVEEEYNIFNAEKAVAKRDAEKATKEAKKKQNFRKP